MAPTPVAVAEVIVALAVGALAVVRTARPVTLLG